MSREDINAIVDGALSDSPAEMRDAFYNAINDKIFDAIEQRKMQVAASLVTGQKQQEVQQTETETEE